MSLSKNLKRIKGISTPFGGISFDLNDTEKDVIRELFIYLEDRRVLFNPYELESPNYVLQSIVQIRDYLTKILIRLDDDSNLAEFIRKMRAACRKLMETNPDNSYYSGMIERAQFFASLGEVRGVFGIYLKNLSERFNIKVETELASIFPLDN